MRWILLAVAVAVPVVACEFFGRLAGEVAVIPSGLVVATVLDKMLFDWLTQR